MFINIQIIIYKIFLTNFQEKLRKSLLRIFKKKYENRSCVEDLKISKIILPIYCGAEHLIFFDLSSTQRKVVP